MRYTNWKVNFSFSFPVFVCSDCVSSSGFEIDCHFSHDGLIQVCHFLRKCSQLYNPGENISGRNFLWKEYGWRLRGCSSEASTPNPFAAQSRSVQVELIGLIKFYWYGSHHSPIQIQKLFISQTSHFLYLSFLSEKKTRAVLCVWRHYYPSCLLHWIDFVQAWAPFWLPCLVMCMHTYIIYIYTYIYPIIYIYIYPAYPFLLFFTFWIHGFVLNSNFKNMEDLKLCIFRTLCLLFYSFSLLWWWCKFCWMIWLRVPKRILGIVDCWASLIHPAAGY